MVGHLSKMKRLEERGRINGFIHSQNRDLMKVSFLHFSIDDLFTIFDIHHQDLASSSLTSHVFQTPVEVPVAISIVVSRNHDATFIVAFHQHSAIGIGVAFQTGQSFLVCGESKEIHVRTEQAMRVKESCPLRISVPTIRDDWRTWCHGDHSLAGANLHGRSKGGSRGNEQSGYKSLEHGEKVMVWIRRNKSNFTEKLWCVLWQMLVKGKRRGVFFKDGFHHVAARCETWIDNIFRLSKNGQRQRRGKQKNLKAILNTSRGIWRQMLVSFSRQQDSIISGGTLFHSMKNLLFYSPRPLRCEPFTISAS